MRVKNGHNGGDFFLQSFSTSQALPLIIIIYSEAMFLRQILI